MNYRFRNLPVVIEAFQMTSKRRVNNVDWPEWLNRAWQLERDELGAVYPTVEGTGDGTLSIRTLEGEHLISRDDWIIFGVVGELYPCNSTIFEKTYEVAEPSGRTYTYTKWLALTTRRIRQRRLK